MLHIWSVNCRATDHPAAASTSAVSSSILVEFDPLLIAHSRPEGHLDSSDPGANENQDPATDTHTEAAGCPEAASDAPSRASISNAPEGIPRRPLPGKLSTEPQAHMSKQRNLGRASISKAPTKLHAASQPVPKRMQNVTVRRVSTAASRQSLSSSKAGLELSWNPDIRVKVSMPEQKPTATGVDKADAKHVRKSVTGGGTVDARKSLSARSTDRSSDTAPRQ